MSVKAKQHKLIIVAGPTASGKTALALELAQKLNGELINADSRQIYKYMDIGTNKGSLTLLPQHIIFQDLKLQAYAVDGVQVPSWLFDLKTPDQLFSVSEYYRIVLQAIADIISRGKVPVIIGGTGLYLDALIKGYDLAPVAPDPGLRAQLATLSAGGLFSRLNELDPDKAATLNQSDRANPRRLIRALELAQATSQTAPTTTHKFDILMFYPKFTREELFRTIDRRVLEMFDQGFLNEVKELITLGFAKAPALQGIGYREVVQYLYGEIDLDTCTKLIQQGHRNYAKRQCTWFEGRGRNYKLHRYDFRTQLPEIFELAQKFLYS